MANSWLKAAILKKIAQPTQVGFVYMYLTNAKDYVDNGI